MVTGPSGLAMVLVLGRAGGENEIGDVGAALRIAHIDLRSRGGACDQLSWRDISAVRGLKQPAIAIKLHRNRFAGGEHEGLVRGNSRQGKHFCCWPATFLCMATYLKVSCGHGLSQ